MTNAGLSHAAVVFCATAFTPLIMRLWSWISPSHVRTFESLEHLKARNWLIDAVATGLCLIGLIGSGLALISRANEIGWPVIGLMFGSMVILPAIWVALATLPQGTHRYREYYRYYSMKWNLGIESLAALNAGLAALGLISAWEVYLRLN